MRVLIFSTDDHLHPAGGAESAMGEITKRLPDIQFDLVCARLRRGAKKYEKVRNVDIHRIGFGIPKLDGMLLALFGYYKARRLYAKFHHDVMWSIMASYGAFAAQRMKATYNIPFLLTLQEGDSIEYILHKVRFVRGRFERIFSSADALQPISSYLQAWGIEMGFSGKHRDVIPNGVDIEAFTKNISEEEVASIRTSYGFPENAQIVMTSSRLEKKNGVGDVIEALSQLDDNVCFVICGDGSLREALEKRVEALHLTHRVRFLGYLPITEIPKHLKASDVFIRASLTEGLGNAFLEAMVSGVLTIGTPVGGIPDFLIDTVNGFMCTPEDSDSIARAIDKALSLTEAEKEAVVANAKKTVISKYDWDNISLSMNELFNTLKKA